MALRPVEPGTESRPDTPETRAAYLQELAEINPDPAAWANDPAFLRVKAKADVVQ